MWTSLEIVKIIVSLSIPLTVAILGYFFSQRLQLIEQKNEKNRQYDLDTKKNEQNELERLHKSRIELIIAANIFGPQEGDYLVEFIITIYNKSLIKHEFDMLNISIHGIKKNTQIEPWAKKDMDKACFPETIISKKSLIPKTKDSEWKFIRVEPGVKQNVTLIIKVPEEIRYLLAHTKFQYDKYTPHTADKMFALQPPRSTDMRTEHKEPSCKKSSR